METEKHMKRYQKQLAKTDILYRPYLDQDIQNAVNGVDACVMTNSEPVCCMAVKGSRAKEDQAFVFSCQRQLSTLSDRRAIL